MNKKHIKSEIKRREEEAYSYQCNIDNYTLMLGELPKDEWKEEHLQYRGKEPMELACMIEDEELLNYIHDMNYRDRIIATLRMEKLAKRIPDMALKVLEKQKCM